MTVVVDLLMPSAGNEYATEAAAIAANYDAAFADGGMRLAPRPWDAGPGDGAAALALFAWGYHVDVDRWLAILAAWPARQPLFNAPGLIRWNTRKTYLAELEAAGIPIVPSLFGDADAVSISRAFDQFGVDTLIVKPQISAGSYRTDRVTRGMTIEPLADAIIQPFLPSVGDAGEWSIFFIGGAFSHAARKVARAGEFRVQPQFGGQFTRLEPDAATLSLAQRAVAAVPGDPLYVRVDLLHMPDGSLVLIELEAIEPDLYLDIEPAAPARLAEALAGRL